MFRIAVDELFLNLSPTAYIEWIYALQICPGGTKYSEQKQF